MCDKSSALEPHFLSVRFSKARRSFRHGRIDKAGVDRGELPRVAAEESKGGGYHSIGYAILSLSCMIIRGTLVMT